MRVTTTLLKLAITGILLLGYMATVQTEDDVPDWFDEDPEAVYNGINEGKLDFLDKPSKTPVHHHHNTLIILEDSIKTGWVKLVQCHEKS